MMYPYGQVVVSTAGRDRGYLLVFVGMLDGMPAFCDGRERPLERPKKKNPAHVRPTGVVLDSGDLRGNKRLRKVLSALSEDAADALKQ